MKKLIIPFVLVLSFSSQALAQSLIIDDGYYKISAEDDDFDWVLHFEGTHIVYYVDKEIAFDFNFDNPKIHYEDNFVKFEYTNPEAPEWQQHFVSIDKTDSNNLEVKVTYSVMEYSDFLKTTEMAPQYVITSYFVGPLSKKEALEN